LKGKDDRSADGKPSKGFGNHLRERAEETFRKKRSLRQKARSPSRSMKSDRCASDQDGDYDEKNRIELTIARYGRDDPILIRRFQSAPER